MQLNHKVLGRENTHPLIILHGLYGSSDNWLNIGQQFAESYKVFLIDQRNHGYSSHSEKHNYHLMRDDLFEFMEQNSIDSATIIGHSMGGKTALFFAVDYPNKVDNLIVVDIAPGPYKSMTNPKTQSLNHLNILNALYNLETDKITNLRDADQALSEQIPFKRVRQFLLKNLKRNDAGNFQWLLNVKALRNELPSILEGIDINQHTNNPIAINKNYPVLFIKGEHSEYIGEDEKRDIKTLFPDAEIQTIKNAGHWVHAEQREKFITLVNSFLQNN